MRNESESWDPCRREHRRPDQTFCDGSAVEHVCWDPKDGELCLNRVKPIILIAERKADPDQFKNGCCISMQLDRIPLTRMSHGYGATMCDR